MKTHISRYDGDQYLMAAGKDEICQFYQITRRKVVVPAGKGNEEKTDESEDKDANNKGKSFLILLQGVN